MIKSKYLVVSLLSVVLLSACTSERIADVEQKMQEIRSSSAKPIEPLPEPERIEDFVYNADDLRSPFVPPSLISLQAQATKETGVKPDVHRIKDPLEEYELAQLIYRGRVISPDGKTHGLIQLPDGSVRNIQIGEYMGKNDGRVLEITPTQINLEEIVPDSQVGFVYKKTPLVTPN